MSGVVTATIISDGKKIKPEYIVSKLETVNEMNKISYSYITLIDGSASLKCFDISDSDYFEPGKTVQIKIRYEGDEDVSIYTGIIVGHKLKVRNNLSLLEIELRSPTIKLNSSKKNVIYDKKNDSDIIKEIVQNAGLKIKKLDSTTIKHETMIQYYCTDWDFILSRAEMNGLLVYCNNEDLELVTPDLSKEETLQLEYGADQILEFNLNTNITDQYKKVEVKSWSIEDQSMSPPQTSSDFKLKQGNTDPSKAAVKIGNESCQLYSSAHLESEEIKSWADSKMIKNRLAMISGSVMIYGDSKVQVGDIINITGIGDRFNGKSLISCITHDVSKKGWTTTIGFGLSPEWFSQINTLVDTQAAGLLPGVNGIQIGIVEDFEEDPGKMLRVKVTLPSIDNESSNSLWARLASPDAGKDRGFFFRPEKNDEVIIGFINDDPRDAVILGSLYSTKNSTPLEIDPKNLKKGLISKEGLKYIFDDEKKVIEISTPSGNIINLDDENGIKITDKNGNEITMSDKGINIYSCKDIIFDGKEINMKGTKVDIC